MLILSFTLLSLNIIGLYLSFTRGQVLMSAFQSAFMLLVTGQCMWISSFGRFAGFEQVGYNFFDEVSAITASVFFIIFQLLLILVTLLLGNFRKARLHRSNECVASTESGIAVPANTVIMVNVAIASVVCPLMIANAGGIVNFLTEPGAMIPGQTFLILLLSILKWDVMTKLMNQENITITSIVFFLIFTVFCLFTSRFLTVFAVLQLLIIYNYYRKPLSSKQILTGSLLIFIIIFFYGIYRDVSSKGVLSYGNLEDFKDVIYAFLPRTFEWFYGENVEVYSGLAEALHRTAGGEDIDFLLSELSFLFNLFPSFISDSAYLGISELESQFQTTVSQKNSVVPSGFEIFVLGLAWPGFFIYGCILVAFLYVCEVNLKSQKNVFFVVLSIQALNGIRGSLISASLFFGIADLLGYRLFAPRRRTQIQ